MSAFDQMLRHWDVVRFLRRHGFEIHLTETGEAHVKCPGCHDHKARLYINRRSFNWTCHNCSGKGRGALSFVKWVLSCDEDKAIKAIVMTKTVAMRYETDAEEEPSKSHTAEEPLPLGYRALELPMDERSTPYWEYVLSRNITPSMVRQYGLGYCRYGPYKGRVIIPVNIFGVRRGWVGRSLSDTVARKYMNPDDVHTSRLLFNIDAVIASGSDKVILVEGVFDALRLPDTAVCTFGKKISIQQIEILREAGFRKWVFCYDGDAIEDAEYFSERMPSGVQCYKVELPEEYDPGNAPMRVLTQAINNAKLWNRVSV